MTDEQSTELNNEIPSQVRGHTTYNQKASWPFRSAALILDSSFLLMLTGIGILLAHPSPRASLIILPVAALAIVLAQIKILPLTRKLLGASLGERIWALKSKNAELFQCDHLSAVGVFKGALSTTLIVLLAFSLIRNVIFEHPLWLKVTEWKPTALSSTIPLASRAFFYSVGAWPNTFANHPVYYSVLYEKGPPKRFVGHISAQLGSPRIRLLIEGPKTPEQLGTRDELKNCLLSTTFSWSCMGQKELALGRHVEEMNRTAPKHWSLQWFSVDDPKIPQRNQTQGIWLAARGDRFSQDRFILINPNGQHQAIILSRPTPLEDSSQGSAEFTSELTAEERKSQATESKAALEQTLATLRSLKVFSHLEDGRNWVNQKLQDVNLAEINSISEPTLKIEKLAEIQSLLLSRISVDPAGFDSYYHLAGTSFLLAKTLQTSERSASPALSAAIQNLNSARSYAQDLVALEPAHTLRLSQMNQLWQDLQKTEPKK